VIARIDDACRSLEIPESERPQILDCMKSEEFRSWIEGKTALHFQQSGYGGVGRKVTFATLIGLAQFYLASKRQGAETSASSVLRAT
jgi:hypothetical protein